MAIILPFLLTIINAALLEVNSLALHFQSNSCNLQEFKIQILSTSCTVHYAFLFPQRRVSSRRVCTVVAVHQAHSFPLH